MGTRASAEVLARHAGFIEDVKMISLTLGGSASCASARCSTQLRTPASRSVRPLSTFRTNNRRTRSTFVVRASDKAPESYQGWLRVDIVPLGALSSPSAVVSEFGLLGIF